MGVTLRRVFFHMVFRLFSINYVTLRLLLFFDSFIILSYFKKGFQVAFGAMPVNFLSTFIIIGRCGCYRSFAARPSMVQDFACHEPFAPTQEMAVQRKKLIRNTVYSVQCASKVLFPPLGVVIKTKILS